MELARVLRQLSKRPRLLALGALIAAFAAIFSVYHLEGGKLKSRSLQYSAASTQVLVDSSSSVLGSVSQASEPLNVRAQVYANLMASPAFLNIVAQQVGLSGSQLYAAGPVKASEARVEQEPTDLKRNVEITGETKPYRLSFESQQELPTITISSQAPSTAQAVALANAAAAGLQRYVASVQSADGTSPHSDVVIRQLGPASGAVVDGGIGKTLAVLVFVAVFLLWCVLLLVAERFRLAWSESALEIITPRGGGDRDRGELAERNEDLWKTAGKAPRGDQAHVLESSRFDLLPERNDDRPAAVAARSTP
jgi:capsular polysaccharide biosynthesis protein